MTVLVAYSADSFGKAAVEHGIREAGGHDEKLVVVNVTRGDAYVDPRYAGKDELNELREQLDSLDIETDLRQVMSADVADHILGVAETEGARLIVVGIRRRSAVGKLVLGSVAQRVILDAACPVLAVKPG